MRERVLLLFLPLVAAENILQLNFTASKPAKLQMDIPLGYTDYRFDVSIPGTIIKHYYALPNTTELSVKLRLTSLPDTLEVKKIMLPLEHNFTVSNTIQFDDLNVTLTSRFLCDKPNDPQCGGPEPAPRVYKQEYTIWKQIYELNRICNQCVDKYLVFMSVVILLIVIVIAWIIWGLYVPPPVHIDNGVELQEPKRSDHAERATIASSQVTRISAPRNPARYGFPEADRENIA